MKKKGFTLIEVVVSLAILGIISISIFSVVANNLNFLSKSKKMSQDTMLTQQKMELEISSLKAKLRDAGHGLTLNTVAIDGVNVDYYEMDQNYNNQKYKAYITQQQLPEYILLKTFDVKANLKSETIDAYNIYPIASSSIKGTHRPDPSTYSTHWMMDLKQWYVSREGFNIPVPRGNAGEANFKHYNYLVNNGLDYEVGTRYPMFPDDYVLIGSNTKDVLSDLDKYAGRHVVYTVTGAAKSGRIGIPENSEPVFISGLGQTDNLVLHLDASYIDPSNSDQVLSANKVTKWLDLSSGINKSSPNEFASQGTDSRRPILSDNPIGEDFVARYLQFDSNKEITITSQGTSNRSIYVFVVAKGKDNSLLLTNHTNLIRMTPSDYTEIYQGWNLFFKEIVNSNNSNFNSFTVGKDDVKIAEIIIYSYTSSLSTSQKTDLYNKVSDYATKKYVEFDPIGEIDDIYDISSEIAVGDNYSPPSSALAKMKYGTDKHVPVIWENGGNFDNTRPGVVVLGGNAVNNPSKKVTLTINIVYIPVERIILNTTRLEMIVGNSYKLDATILPDNATDQRINWSSEKSSVATVDSNGNISAIAKGTTVITAKALDSLSNAVATVELTVITEEDLVMRELNEALERTTISVTNATNQTPTLSTPTDSNGIIYTFTNSSPTSGNSRITIAPNKKTATVYRNSSTNSSGTITLNASKNGYNLSVIYNVSIPRNSSPRGSVTVSNK